MLCLEENYYGHTIAAMFIIGLHPDCGHEAFVHRVPDMSAFVQLMLIRQREQAEAHRFTHEIDGRFSRVEWELHAFDP